MQASAGEDAGEAVAQPVSARRRVGRRRGDDRSPAELSLHARMAALALHATVSDPAAHTAPARAAFLARFEREVDPDGVLPAAERTRRAEYARRAYFARLALAAARARRRRRLIT